MKEQIKALVTARDHVSFAELAREIDGFKGNIGWELRGQNVYLWTGLSEKAFDALVDLIESEDIHFVPASLLAYLIDGITQKLPLAKDIKPYKKPHWFPVILRPGKGIKGKALQVKVDDLARCSPRL